jgi:hypothetical protein
MSKLIGRPTIPIRNNVTCHADTGPMNGIDRMPDARIAPRSGPPRTSDNPVPSINDMAYTDNARARRCSSNPSRINE